mmetsp:Transcript_36552/g.112620  ORF Transcript_36552/g.112620 Transcript_36552/m.112620 type:complete len:218 (+) Transcript_36552:7358-8011(+)
MTMSLPSRVFFDKAPDTAADTAAFHARRPARIARARRRPHRRTALATPACTSPLPPVCAPASTTTQNTHTLQRYPSPFPRGPTRISFLRALHTGTAGLTVSCARQRAKLPRAPSTGRTLSASAVRSPTCSSPHCVRFLIDTPVGLPGRGVSRRTAPDGFSLSTPTIAPRRALAADRPPPPPPRPAATAERLHTRSTSTEGRSSVAEAGTGTRGWPTP